MGGAADTAQSDSEFAHHVCGGEIYFNTLSRSILLYFQWAILIDNTHLQEPCDANVIQERDLSPLLSRTWHNVYYHSDTEAKER